MKEAWICPKCNIGVAPHCDTCPNCTKPNDWQAIEINDFPPRKPYDTVSVTTTGTPKIYIAPYDPTITVKWSFTL